jgi:hypothetical protein
MSDITSITAVVPLSATPSGGGADVARRFCGAWRGRVDRLGGLDNGVELDMVRRMSASAETRGGRWAWTVLA